MTITCPSGMRPTSPRKARLDARTPMQAWNPSRHHDSRRDGFRARATARPGMTKTGRATPTRHACAFPRHHLPEFCLASPQWRAQGVPGAKPHPRPCVRNEEAHKQVTTGWPDSPALPAQWCYGLFRALPGDRAFLPPSPTDRPASLTSASRSQNHTASPSRSASFVRRCRARPSHPALTFVTTRTPLLRSARRPKS